MVSPESTSSRRLAMFLDGTWDLLPDACTNVKRMKALVAPVGFSGVEQVVYYEGGVGFIERVVGGVVPVGVDVQIKEAYSWLMESYQDGDELFLFGFSRGAYSANCLAGMLDECGLLSGTSPLTVDQLYQRYRQSNDPSNPISHATKRVIDEAPPERYTIRDNFAEYSLRKYSKTVTITYIGLLDNVAPSGIPLGSFRNVSSSTLAFRRVGMCANVLSARHALALDEFRQSFRPTLWIVAKGECERIHDPDLPRSPSAHCFADRIEQRWFSGSHSNVGGGYPNDALQQISMVWIMEGAERAGLAFRQAEPIVVDECIVSPVVDSRSSALFGIYQYVPVIGAPNFRAIGEAGTPDVENVNETIDVSVFKRWQTDPTYRPANLVKWASDRRIDLSTAIPATRHACSGVPVNGCRTPASADRKSTFWTIKPEAGTGLGSRVGSMSELQDPPAKDVDGRKIGKRARQPQSPASATQ